MRKNKPKGRPHRAAFWLLWALVGACACLFGASPAETRFPAPLEIEENLPTSWGLVHDVLAKMGYEVDSEDRSEGRITTREDAGVSGAGALATLKKIAVVANDCVSIYHEGRYTIEVVVSFLRPDRTSISAFATISGLKRAMDGKEEWVKLESNGVLEKRLMNEISFAANGKRPYGDDLPYWKKSSQEISIKK